MPFFSGKHFWILQCKQYREKFNFNWKILWREFDRHQNFALASTSKKLWALYFTFANKNLGNSSQWKMESSGEDFVKLLKELNCPGADELQGEDVDWLFETSAQPLMKWICSSISPANCLTVEEAKRWKEFPKGQLILKCHFGVFNSSKKRNFSQDFCPSL